MVRKKVKKKTKQRVTKRTAKRTHPPIKLNSIESTPPGWAWAERLTWLVERLVAGPHDGKRRHVWVTEGCDVCDREPNANIVPHGGTFLEHAKYLTQRGRAEMKSTKSKRGG